MSHLDSQPGFGTAPFPSTHWSRLDASDASDGAAAMEHLASHYWRPVYAFIRRRRNTSHETAKDLTQQFFLWAIESGFLSRARPGQGRFRNFVRTTLDHFLTDEHRRASAIKRSGGRPPLSLEAFEGAVETPSPGPDPAAALDLDWRNEILRRAFQVLDSTYEKAGRRDWVALWREYDLQGSSDIDYAELAARHACSARDISYRLTHVRRSFRRILVEIVIETVDGPESLEQELRELFGVRLEG